MRLNELEEGIFDRVTGWFNDQSNMSTQPTASNQLAQGLVKGIQIGGTIFW